MDAAIIFGTIGAAVTVGTSLVVITVHASKTRGIAEGAAHKVRNLENVLPAVYARKDVLEEKFAHIQDALERIEANQKRGGMGV